LANPKNSRNPYLCGNSGFLGSNSDKKDKQDGQIVKRPPLAKIGPNQRTNGSRTEGVVWATYMTRSYSRGKV
jgi:hypothetical protein